jgi:hypothetical protein
MTWRRLMSVAAIIEAAGYIVGHPRHASIGMKGILTVR